MFVENYRHSFACIEALQLLVDIVIRPTLHLGIFSAHFVNLNGVMDEIPNSVDILSKCKQALNLAREPKIVLSPITRLCVVSDNLPEAFRLLRNAKNVSVIHADQICERGQFQRKPYWRQFVLE